MIKKWLFLAPITSKEEKMIKNVILLVLVLVLFNGSVFSQKENKPATNRFKNIKELLDYRYKGGFYSFEKTFLDNVSYTEQARKNCVIGIMIASFEVDCNGKQNFEKIKIKNPLHFGLDNQVSKFLNATQGHWNTCHDKKYTRFEIPIQFTMKGTKTNEDDAVLVLEGKNPGYVCTGDTVYLERAKKYLKKGKSKKAIKAIEILIKRNPYTTEYYDMLKQVLNTKKK